MKTPKEEAEEIVEKFLGYAHTHYDELNGFVFRSGKESAIKIAIIHVKGLIKELIPNEYKMNGMVLVESVHDRILELKKVLTELKKM